MDLMIHQKLSKYMLVDGFSHVVDFEKSHGVWFVDVNGKEYLDCYSMHSAMPISWNHPKLLTKEWKLHKYAKYNPSNSDCYSEQQLEFVEAFAKITPDFKHYFFISGGALAVENALKAAFDWKAQKLGIEDQNEINKLDVIHFSNAFHGRSGYTLSVTNTTPEKTRYFPKFNWTNVLCYSGLEETALKVVEDRAKTGIVAAILVEPIQSEGGDIHFSPMFFHELRRIANENECLLILDEVQTGMGLTGKMWCYEHYSITPDLMSFGKKAQVCGFCSTNRIDEIQTNVFNVSGRINSTWGGNLTDMIRSTIFMEIVQEDKLVENAAVVGEYFLSKLKELEGPTIRFARGKGLLLAFDLEDSAKRDEFLNKLNEKVLCLKCGPKSIRFRPHLDFQKEHVDYVIDCLKSLV